MGCAQPTQSDTVKVDETNTTEQNNNPKIYIGMISRKVITLDYISTDTGLQLKQKVFEKEQIPCEKQIISFASRMLDDTLTLAEQSIVQDNTLKLVLKK
ncbi:Ubiquitin [Hexamita inflata]|uniref:Ubiquitin n=1 Tax=Hexamita inflata TaxID=28002 RepID=A0AA86UAM9_9EUKA|nr:Ubiquitin [Hexamita inflata]